MRVRKPVIIGAETSRDVLSFEMIERCDRLLETIFSRATC
jgi:hypothetical protein